MKVREMLPIWSTIGLAIMLGSTALMAGPRPVAGHELVQYRDIVTTNGVMKTAIRIFPHNDCGVYSEIELVVYYDIATATTFRVNRIKINYWVKGSSTSGVWGGYLELQGRNATVAIPNNLADHNSFYRYNAATRDPDGYSLAGSYTHQGPRTLTPFVSGDRRYIRIWKRTNIDNAPSCMGDWDYSELQLRW